MSADPNHPSTVSILTRLVGIVSLAAVLAGCGGSGSGQTGTENAFVFLTVERFSVNGSATIALATSSIDDADTTTSICVTLRNNLKNPTITAPSSLDNVIIQTYTVDFARFDTQPVRDNPFSYSFAVLVPAGTAAAGSAALTGNTATFPIVLVTPQIKRDPRLRPPSRFPINATATVTFRGRDGRGQKLEAEGSIAVTFVNAGTDTTASCNGTTTTTTS